MGAANPPGADQLSVASVMRNTLEGYVRYALKKRRASEETQVFTLIGTSVAFQKSEYRVEGVITFLELKTGLACRTYLGDFVLKMQYRER